MIEKCVCGGYIPVLEDQSIEGAVVSHNLSATHREWRRKREATEEADRDWRDRLDRLDGYDRVPMTPTTLRAITRGRE